MGREQMVIEFSVNEGIAIHRMTGELDPSGLVDYIRDGILKWANMQVLWDLNAADLSRLSIESAREIVLNTKEPVKIRQNMKTAILSHNSVHSGILALFEAVSKFEENPVELKIFQSRSSACRWLLS